MLLVLRVLLLLAGGLLFLLLLLKLLLLELLRGLHLLGLCCDVLLLAAGHETRLVEHGIGHTNGARRADGHKRGLKRILLGLDVLASQRPHNLPDKRLVFLDSGLIPACPRLFDSDIGQCRTHLQFLLLLCCLILLSLRRLFLRRHLGLVRVALSGDLADTCDHLIALRHVHAFHDEVEHDERYLRCDRRNLLEKREQLFCLRLADGDAPVLIGNDKIRLRPDDIVLGQTVVDGDVVRDAAAVRDAEGLLFGEILLHQRERLLAMQLNGKAQVVEDPRCRHGALFLTPADGHTAGGVGGAPHAFVGDAGQRLNHGDRPAHDIEVRWRQLAVYAQLQLVPLLVADDAVRPRVLLRQLLQIVHSALFHEHFVGREDVESLRRALVDVLLNVAHRADDAVRQVVPVAAVAPDRREREIVVTVR